MCYIVNTVNELQKIEEDITMMNVTLNNEKNGIEIRFDEKPEREVLDQIKANGFRWSKPQKMWYAKQSDSRIEFVKSLSNDNVISTSKEIKQNNDLFDLWDMTRVDDIENHFKNEHIYDTKEIAARIRKHLRSRFPMCKWSVRSDINSISLYLKSSPWDKDSEEVKAIAHYAYKYEESFNYDNSDSMSDYFDVNFYGCYEHSIVSSYEYEQREETVNEHRISDLFKQKKKEFETAEEIRREKEYQEYLKQMEIEREEARKYEEIRKKNIATVERNTKVEDVDNPYFIINLKERFSKEPSVGEYFKDRDWDDVNKNGKLNKWKRKDAKVSRNVYMDKTIYDLFSNLLLCDFTFINCMGGTATNDNRINSLEDYNRMSTEERETVKFYSVDCIAVWCEESLMMVIDPQGYNYARYCFFPDEETVINGEYSYNQIVSDDEKENNRILASELEDVSAEIIMQHDMAETWDNESVNEYKSLMKEWIYDANFKLNVGVVREIKIQKLKDMMYRLLTEVEGVQEQFYRAGLVEGEKITLIKFNDFGGLSTSKGIFKGYKAGRYAQYNDTVKFIYRPEKKRKDYYLWLYKDFLLYRGWVDYPDDLLWKTIKEDFNSTMRMTRYMSCDRTQYDVIMEYFRDNGINPVINTYKPQF